MFSEQSLLRRLRRHFAKEGLTLRKKKVGPYSDNLPDYILLEGNTIRNGFYNLEEKARELGLVKTDPGEWEAALQQQLDEIESNEPCLVDDAKACCDSAVRLLSGFKDNQYRNRKYRRDQLIEAKVEIDNALSHLQAASTMFPDAASLPIHAEGTIDEWRERAIDSETVDENPQPTDAQRFAHRCKVWFDDTLGTICDNSEELMQLVREKRANLAGDYEPAIRERIGQLTKVLEDARTAAGVLQAIENNPKESGKIFDRYTVRKVTQAAANFGGIQPGWYFEGEQEVVHIVRLPQVLINGTKVLILERVDASGIEFSKDGAEVVWQANA